MRVPSGVEPAQPLTHMWERHREIARRLVSGDKPREIAQSLGMTETRLSIITNSPVFQIHLQELSAKADEAAADVSGRISKLAIESMTVLENAIRVKSDEISATQRTKFALESLAMAGFGAVQKVASVSTVLTVDDLNALKRRAKRETYQGEVNVIEGTKVG